ncbi:putative membrane-bound metal-dependent hydrolase [Halorubrum californiense DSM 19288]|uniref:Putative membrane-bound metal-dependent hydrolase n=1 Tax=Halorubrum californiense DSM 19288 TaxID=1227465 RepID=M0E401_9EURY|nr:MULTISPECIES: metal-dependent hydrolase [Halorubrum]ELZ41682.1 putative membrane-bound metal-dependent hydrolase [Halorubrum californiense DSM 19288]TKX66083.1 metal-dependent hydrolase [Halorubrum sp. GN11GM_10-3_MGM]
MFPHEHLLVALLPVVAYVAVRDRHLPTRGVAFATAVGTQFPDLVDKPLAHQFGVLPSGRVFIHSLPFALPVIAGVLAYGRSTGRPRVAGAFAAAYLSHLVGDTYRSLLAGQVPPDLLWPFVAAQPRPTVPFWAGVDGINVRLWTAFSAVVLAVTLAVVTWDIRRQLRRTART